MTTQLITPNPDIACTPGMCLQYVRQAFGLPIRYGSAAEAWDNSTSQHPDYNFPADCWVPVWFSLEAIPAGHVALRAPDGTVYSSSDNSSTPHHHPSLIDLLNYYAYYNLPLTYLGWSEDVAGYAVVSVDSSINFESATPAAPTTPQEDTVTPEQMNELKLFVQACVNDSINKMWATEGVTQQLVKDTVASLSGHLVIDPNQAEDIVAAVVNRVPAAVVDYNYRPGANISGALDAISAKPSAAGSAAPLDPKAIAAAFVSGVNIQITQK